MKPSASADARVTVRRATLNDSAALARLADQLGYPSSPEQIASRLTQVLSRSDHAVLVADVLAPGSRAQVAGWIHAYAQRILEGDPAIEIAGLIVDENCRGLGIGNLLIHQLELWAREAGYRAIGVRSNIIRERAHRFYERLGFAPVKTQRVFRKTLE